MSCTDCTDCSDTTPKIPECFTGDIDLGDTGNPTTAYIIEVEKLSTGASFTAEVSSDGAGLLTVSLADFTTDTTFWRRDAGKYRISVREDADYDLVTLSDVSSPVNSATCITIEFSGQSDYSGDLVLTYS